ncbi:DNA invertase Pin-like site-specific DNA recombinase [Streptomyces sp. TLI_235]|nr:recombinase family protein [Streptomyces sp. TLI_235]PBC77601.1 DNA invertase Pin-like site-specific DNA recombinase [Streptomyces sp. TLI_235]
MTDTAEPAQVRAAIYCRLSSDPTGRAANVQRQEADCRALAKELGWTVVDVHTDNDISAYAGKPRPGYRMLLQGIRTGQVDAVLAWHTDRLYRRLPDLEDLVKAVQERNVMIRTCKAGIIDLSTASGIMTAEIQASVSKHEVAHLIERVKAAKDAAAAKGAYRGGPRPFGYESDGVTPRSILCPSCGSKEGFGDDRACQACGTPAVNEQGSEAWFVEQATLAIVDGESLRSICRTWAESGVRTVPRRFRQADGTRGEPESREWKAEELRKLLLRPRNAGLLEVSAVGPDGKKKSEIAGQASWPPIVDEETWRASKAVLENPARRTTTGNGRVWLLTRLAHCWCGAPVRGSSKGVGGNTKAQKLGRKTLPAYRCTDDPNHVVRDSHQLDKYITDLVVARLSRPNAAELHLKSVEMGEPHEDLARQAANLRTKLDSIAADYAQDLITRQQMLDATAITRQRLNTLTAQMAGRASSSVLVALPLGDAAAMAELWPTLHLDRRRQAVEAVMSIVINRSKRGRPKGYRPGVDTSYFDPDTIDVTWKPPA